MELKAETSEQAGTQALNIPVVTTSTFERTWKNARLDPPKEGGRYWCLIEEQNDLGKSHFQWNCSYHETEKRWSDNTIRIKYPLKDVEIIII